MSKLKLFRITGDLSNLDKSLQIFVDLSYVYPIESNEFINRVHGLTAISAENSYKGLYQKIEDIELNNSIAIESHDFNIDKIDFDFEATKNYVLNIHESSSKLLSIFKEEKQLKVKYQDALTQVNNIEKLNVSLDALFSCEYISIRFGKLPKDSLEILKMYDKKEFYFELFEEEINFIWCMYITTVKHEKEIDNIFSSLYFEKIYIPDFVHGTPENAIESLKTEIRAMDESLLKTKQEIDELIVSNIDKLSDVKGYLIYLERISLAKKYVVGLGEKFNITGFISEKNVEDLNNSFKSVKNIEIDIMPSDFDKRLKPPKHFEKSISKLFKI